MAKINVELILRCTQLPFNIQRVKQSEASIISNSSIIFVRSVYYYCSRDPIAPVPVPAPDEQGLAGDEVGTVVVAIGWLVE